MACAAGACRDSLARSPRIHASQIGDERRAPFGPDGKALLGGKAVDVALDVEQEIDAFDGLEGDGRDRWRILSSARIGSYVGEHEELAPGVAPAERLRHRAWLPIGEVEPIVAGIGIGLQDSGELLQMLFRMITRPVARCVEQCRRRCWSAERSIVADIGPGSAGIGLALRQDRHGRVVAVKPLRGQHMVLDQRMQRTQRRRARADLIGQRRQASSTPSRA